MNRINRPYYRLKDIYKPLHYGLVIIEMSILLTVMAGMINPAYCQDNAIKMAPNFSLPNQSGKIVNLKDVLASSKVVLFFYPKDDSPGCTAEVCSFRDSYQKFAEAGAEVIGISSDSVDSHVHFQSKHKLPFELLSDKTGSVRALYKVPSTLGLIPGRMTFVIDQKGIIIYSFNSQLNVDQHIATALSALKACQLP